MTLSQRPRKAVLEDALQSLYEGAQNSSKFCCQLFILKAITFLLQVPMQSSSSQELMTCHDIAQESNGPAHSPHSLQLLHGGEGSVASQGRKGNHNWGTGCYQACSRFSGDSSDHASSMCHKTNTWERDTVSWDGGDAGAAQGSACTAEP